MNDGKNTLYEVLVSAQAKKLNIPVYQRPYEWEAEVHVDTLFCDLQEAYEEFENHNQENKKFFLGNIIVCENNGNTDIIDGQQRLTTIMLLLRAILLEIDPELRVYHDIERSIWKLNNDEEETPNISSPNLIADSDYIIDFKTFNYIMENGSIENEDNSVYAKNYSFLKDSIGKLRNSYAGGRILTISRFARFILDHTILNVFKTTDLNDAFDTFRVLNSKGLPLSQADMFKAVILANTNADQRNSFLKKWSKIHSDSAETIKEGIDILFTAYMEYLHALDGNDSKYPKLKDFFEENNSARLRPYQNEEVMNNLESALNFYKYAEKRELDAFTSDQDQWTQNSEIQKVFDILRYVPIRTWISPWIYYKKWNGNYNFENMYIKFLKKYTATVLASYINKPGEKCIANKRPALNLAIVNSNDGNINFTNINFEYANIEDIVFEEKIRENTKPVYVKPLLAMLAYLENDQQQLLPETWEIEHIVPQHADTAVLFKECASTIKPLIERIGNKMPLEKKRNAKASDNYFTNKARIYRESNIIIARNMANQSESNWQTADRVIETIPQRESDIVKKLKDNLRNWQEL